MDIQVTTTQDQVAEGDVLFSSIGEGAIVTDANARISRINRAALDILGFREKELLGKWFPQVIKAEDDKGNPLANIERPITEVFITGKTVTRKTNYRRKDGSVIPVNLTVSPVIINNKPIGAIEVFRDITDEVALERAKDEFVAIASHQLRTPATAVKQYVGLLLDGYAEPMNDNQLLFLKRAYDSNERQLHIVQEILKVTQLDLDKLVLKLDLHDIRKIIKEAIDGLQQNFTAKNQKVNAQLPKKPIYANIDSEQVKIAVENLLENASNYTWKDKSITVTVAQDNKNTTITVKDQGVGINKADYPKLFKKFSRVPNDLSLEIGGTGLGLYWALKIIELHGGEISIESTPGKGSSFTILLPR